MRIIVALAIALTATSLLSQTISQETPVLNIRARTASGAHPVLKSINVYRAGNAIYYRVPIMEIDYDGAPNAYHPPVTGHPHGQGPGLGLDDLRNASKNGRDDSAAQWSSLVTDKAGVPRIQKEGPFAGFYISTTSLQDERFKECDFRRYVDSTKVPYVALNPLLQRVGLDVGDLAVVILNPAKPKIAYGIVGDVGGTEGLGEASKALADSIGSRHGIEGVEVLYIFFPTPSNRKVRSVDQIHNELQELFTAWGGIARARSLP
jgi:hypothetical protein